MRKTDPLDMFPSARITPNETLKRVATRARDKAIADRDRWKAVAGQLAEASRKLADELPQGESVNCDCDGCQTYRAYKRSLMDAAIADFDAAVKGDG